MLRRTLGPTVILDMDFPGQLSRVLTDTNQLELAILNLAVNARDAMPHGGRITISARHKTVSEGVGDALDPGDYVSLTVTDTGEGMDEATLKSAR